MSTILDALKKSERERQRNQAPTLASIDQHFVPSQKAGPGLGVWLVLVLLALALIAGGYWFYSQIAARQIHQAGQADNVMPSRDEVKVAPPVAVTEPAADPQNATALREYWQLPPDVRAAIPELHFSLHVYSAEAGQRSIIINNRMMREGESLNRDLRLLEITADGVILDYRGERFKVAVLENW